MKRIFASLVLVFCLNVKAESLETDVFLPAFNATVKVFTASIQISSNQEVTYSATISRDFSIANSTMELASKAGLKIAYYPNGDLIYLALTNGKLKNSLSDVDGFTYAEFFRNGAVSRITRQHNYSKKVGDFTTTRGKVNCIINHGISFFDDGHASTCVLDVPKRISLKDGSSVLVNRVFFHEYDVLASLGMVAGALPATCVNGQGEISRLQGNYALNADETFHKVNTWQDHLVRQGEYSKRVNQLTVINCRIMGGLGVYLTEETRVNGLRVITTGRPYNDYGLTHRLCVTLGFVKWGLVAKFNQDYILNAEDFYDAASASVIQVPAGSAVNLLNGGACGFFGELVKN